VAISNGANGSFTSIVRFLTVPILIVVGLTLFNYTNFIVKNSGYFPRHIFIILPLSNNQKQQQITMILEAMILSGSLSKLEGMLLTVS
jgi:hypothetical protein